MAKDVKDQKHTGMSLLLVTFNVIANGFLGFVTLVFAAAGAGNAGKANFFVEVLLPICIGAFLMLVISSYVLVFRGKPSLAIALPVATLPLLFVSMIVGNSLLSPKDEDQLTEPSQLNNNSNDNAKVFPNIIDLDLKDYKR